MSPKNCFFSASRKLALLVIVVMVASGVSVAEWKEKVLYSFQGGSDGALPSGGVVFDKAGNLYGTTLQGGVGTYPPAACGTVFELSPPAKKGDPWTETVLYVFKGRNSSDGSSPTGGVVLDASGNLYGTTGYGGAGPCELFGTLVGCGTVFKLSPPAKQGDPWTETVLYSFHGGKDGYLPGGALTWDQQGNLYGVTSFGGGYGTCNKIYGFCGTVFELSPPKTKRGKWTETMLHSFKGGKDGANPNGGLVFDGKGAIYGTTSSGGNQGCKSDSGTGCGAVFRLKPPAQKSGAWSDRLLHVFTDGNDGAGPSGNLVFDAKGVLYGETGGGGSKLSGVVFSLAQTGGHWGENVLYSFSGADDGFGPGGGLMFDPGGNLCGTAFGGADFRGTVFRVKSPRGQGSQWTFDLLYTLKGAPDAAYPASNLIPDLGGHLYTTTQGGGTGAACNGGCGTVLELQP
jgi:hypothetical protein